MVIFLLVLFLLGTTTACGVTTGYFGEDGSGGASSSAGVQSRPDVAVSVSVPPPSSPSNSKRPPEGSSVQVPAAEVVSAPNSMSTEIYVCSIDESGFPFLAEYAPRLSLYPDGTFDLAVNLYEGMGLVSGEYTSSENGFSMTVTDRSFSGVVGENVGSFEFIANGTELRYSGGFIGATVDGAIFVRL